MVKKKTKRKKKSCRTSLSGEGTPRSPSGASALDDIDTDLPTTPKSGLDSDLSDTDVPTPDLPATELPYAAISLPGEEDSELSTAGPSSSRGVTTAHHSRSSSATADLDSQSSAADLALETAGLEAVRAALEAAVTQANSAIEIGVAAGDDVLQRVLDELDTAIQTAVEGGVSAKYSKKIRKRLQQLVHEAVNMAASGGEEAAAVAEAAASAAVHRQEWQTAGAKQHRPAADGGHREALVATAGKHHTASGRQRSNRHQGQGHSGQTLIQLLQASGVAGPPPPPPPRHTHAQPLGQTASSGQQSKGEQASGALGHSAEGPGPVRTRSGNAWGVPAKQRSIAQVRFTALSWAIVAQTLLLSFLLLSTKCAIVCRLLDFAGRLLLHHVCCISGTLFAHRDLQFVFSPHFRCSVCTFAPFCHALL